MRNDFTCSLNGEEMHLLDPRIYIEDIEETVKNTAETGKRPHYGQTLVGPVGHDTIAVTVSFMIKEPNRFKRQQIITKINGWAQDGWLTVNTRPWQRIYVVCTQPVSTEAFKWSADMKLVFTAYDEAYWQTTLPVIVTGSGTSDSLAINPLGTHRCGLEAEIKNTSGSAVNTLSLSVNGKTMAFEGLGLANNKTLIIGYDERHYLFAKVDGVSKLNCRTAASADDLWLNPGVANTVQCTCQHVCSIKLIARGAYD